MYSCQFLKDYTEEYKDLEIDDIVMYIEAIPDIDYIIDNEEILGIKFGGSFDCWRRGGLWIFCFLRGFQEKQIT